MRRGRRERVVGDFGLEAISVQDIDFLGVAGVVACEIIGEVGGVGNVTGVGVAGGEAIGEVGGVASDVAGEVSKVGGEAIGEVGGVASEVAGEAVAKGIATGVGGVGFSAFTCFVRTCS